MRLATVLLSLVASVAALRGPHADDVPSSRHLQLRDVSTCEQAYGVGWTGCSGGNFAGCYNPDLGQTCCPEDGGHCQAGSYCAPVAGHCCPDEQSVQECGRARGFEVNEQPGLGDYEPATGTTTVTITITRTMTMGPPEKPWTSFWVTTTVSTIDLQAHPVTSEPTNSEPPPDPRTILGGGSSAALPPDGPAKMHLSAVETANDDIPSHPTPPAVEPPFRPVMAVPGYPAVNRSDIVPTLRPHVSQAMRQGAASSLTVAIIMAVLAFW